MPRKPRRVGLDAKEEQEMAANDSERTVWVENLRGGSSNFKSRTGDQFHWEGNGFAGSVVGVPDKVTKEAYFRRTISAGNLRILSDEEAAAREEELVFVDEGASEVDRTMEALEKGASESGSRYKKKGLSDDGSEGRSQTAREVWEGREPKAAPGTVRRSSGDSDASDRAAADITAPAIPSGEVPDGPIPAVITEPVKEGEWKSDTGE